MKERQQLKKNILLCGRSTDGGFKRNFTIEKCLPSGGSVLCYAAQNDQLGRGILKEFYPQDAYAMERNPEGQLVPAPGYEAMFQKFQKEEAEYVKNHELLLQAKHRNKNKELDTFIPSFEIYYGCDEQKNKIGTTYIWSPEPELETFDKICGEIHAQPGKNPEHKLVKVLCAMDSLAKCIQVLHSEGMLHLDIKPSNFGFVKRGKETLTQAISMFDINSVCSIYRVPEEFFGTKEYLEPEIKKQKPDIQTDIYAMGATLFQAIVVTEETKQGGYYYKTDYYDRIKELVDNSLLIRDSEANSHPRLRQALATILRKSLCRRRDRYENCEELLKDLDNALFYALPSDIARKQRAGMKWMLVDVEEYFQKHQGSSSVVNP